MLQDIIEHAHRDASDALRPDSSAAGYQNMCRWNFMGLVRHPRIQALDYYCRLDTHSFVRSPLGYDLFDFMAARRLAYGFVAVESEPAHVIAGATPLTLAKRPRPP